MEIVKKGILKSNIRHNLCDAKILTKVLNENLSSENHHVVFGFYGDTVNLESKHPFTLKEVQLLITVVDGSAKIRILNRFMVCIIFPKINLIDLEKSHAVAVDLDQTYKLPLHEWLSDREYFRGGSH